jgi:hypothetical protein
MFMGPIWPAWVAIPKENYGLALRASDMALALAAAKAGMAVEQLTCSWVLANHARGRYFSAVLLAFLAMTAVACVSFLYVLIPRAGLQPLIRGRR